jgi:outer membrane protein TolC
MGRRIVQQAFLFLFSGLGCIGASAQEKVLSLENTLDIIRKYHPVAKQSVLLVDMAEANLQASRGAFDPSFYTRNERKTFDGKNYYNYSNPELKIPTWFGINVKAGLENNQGDKINPEITPNRSTYVGVSFPVLKGLLLDQRRAVLQQSKLMVQKSKQEQLLMINDLLFDAADVYWNWVSAYQVYNILTSAVQFNEKRFEFVKLAYQSGDRAAIDTTEALSQLQTIQTIQSQAWAELQKQRLYLSNFMWNEAGDPYELLPEISPDPSWNLVEIVAYPMPDLDQSISVASTAHPKLIALGFKQKFLEVDKRLRLQGLLPTLDLKYNFLNEGYTTSKLFAQPLMENNYRFGIQFGLPLFQREARGEYRAAKIKIADLDYTQQQTQLQIVNKVKSTYNELLATQSQVLLYQSNVQNLQKLLKAEETKFEIGESSMFLVNTRETKLLESQQKLAELKAKFFTKILAIQWATGQVR